MSETGNAVMMRVKKILIALAISFLLLIIGLATYSYLLIERISDGHSLKINSHSIDASKHNAVIRLEQDSVFMKEDLEFLFPFLSDQDEDFSEWIKNLEQRGEIVELSYLGMNDFYEVHKEITLSLVRVNDCSRHFCFQHRLDFSEIPSSLWRGLIGVEDARFLEHSGVDPQGILRAIFVAIKNRKISQGGSTLTQQLVKNLFLTQEKTLKRKFNEMIISLYLETRFSKEEILQAYFNEVVWGGLGDVRLKGVYAASLYYFSKKPRKLNAYESSILSALLKGPYFYHPLKNLKGLIQRSDLLYKTLQNKKFISKYDDSRWGKAQWGNWQKYLIKRDADPRLRSFAYAMNTFDFYDQFILKTISDEQLKKLKEREHLKDKDLSFKVLVQDFENCESENCPNISFYSKQERDHWDAISKEKHQVGSLLKPFVYSIGFDMDRDPEDRMATEKVEISLPSGVWSPHDSETDEPMMTLSQALKKSKNIPLIRFSRELGFDVLEQKLKKFVPTLKSPLAEFPSQLLGSIELSISELAGAYQKLFRSECIKDLEEKESVLKILANPRETTLSGVVGPYLGDQRFFGKTGTSNNSFDNWFIGLHNGRSVLVWLGLEGKRNISEKLYVSGASTAFRFYEQYKLRSGHAMSNLICGEMFLE